MFVSFDVSNDSGIFGFTVTKVSDSRLEFFAFIVVALLFFNHFFRMLSEATRFEPFNFLEVFEDVDATEQQNRDAIDQLSLEFGNAQATISNLKKFDFANAIQNMESDLKSYAYSKSLLKNKPLIENLINERTLDDLTLESHDKTVQEMMSHFKERIYVPASDVDSFHKSADTISGAVHRAEEISRSVQLSISRYNEQKNELKTTGAVYATVGSNDFRLIFFEILVPILLFSVCISVRLSEFARDYFLNVHL